MLGGEGGFRRRMFLLFLELITVNSCLHLGTSRFHVIIYWCFYVYFILYDSVLYVSVVGVIL